MFDTGSCHIMPYSFILSLEIIYCIRNYSDVCNSTRIKGNLLEIILHSVVDTTGIFEIRVHAVDKTVLNLPTCV